MPEPVLDRPGVNAVIGQLVAATMPQHVEVDRQREVGAPTDDLHQPVDGIGRERRSALAGEDVDAVGIFLAQRRQQAQLFPPDGVNGRTAILGPVDVQGSIPAELGVGLGRFRSNRG
jgi:hypothetical protein